MKKRILKTVIIVILMIICAFLVTLFERKACNDSEEFLTEWEDLNVSQSSTTSDYNECSETETLKEDVSMEELAILMSDDIANISYNYNIKEERMNWFKEYKEVIKKYPLELHSTTIYEAYSEEDLDLLFKIIQSEVGDYGFIETSNVASVIFNRSKLWGMTLYEVLTSKGQFSVYANGTYKNVIPDEETILACEFVYIFGDTTFGCVGFRSHRSCPEKWKLWGDNYWEKQFSDDAHCFYK